MHNNQVYSEYVTVDSVPRKLWHRRWFKIICISFIALTICAATLALVLKFAILAPRKPESTTITATPPSPTTTTASQPTTAKPVATPTPTQHR